MATRVSITEGNLSMGKIVVITAQNLASLNVVRPVLESLGSEIESLIVTHNIPIRNWEDIKRIARLVSKTCLPFIAFKLLEIDFHSLLVRWKGKDVSKLARRTGVKVKHFTSTNMPECVSYLKQVQPDYLVNTGPNIISKEVIGLSRVATLSCHGAKLPEYRGPANYVWTLLNGDTSHHVTIHRMVPKLDAGPVWSEIAFPIDPTWSVYRYNYESARRAGTFLADTLKKILSGSESFSERVQDEDRAVKRSFPTRNDIRRLRSKGIKLVTMRDVFDCI